MSTVQGVGNIVSKNLVLYLDAANPISYPGSGTSWLDLSGYKNNASFVNGPVYNSSNAGVITFDGTDDYVTVPNSTSWDFTTSLTIELWVYVNSYDPLGVMLIHQQNGGAAGGFEFWVQNNVIRFYKNASTQIIASSASFSVGRWNHVVVTIEGITGRIYLNTTVVGTTATATVPDNVTGQLRIGSYINTGFYDLNGKISCVRIYNEKALSSQEITQNYNAQKGRFGL